MINEQARTALCWVRSRSDSLGIDDHWFDKHDIHLHVSTGSVPKDGPSAGITMATANSSLVSQRVAHHNVAMTGEITLRGLVLPIVGAKEKVLAAHPFGLVTDRIPKNIEKDLVDVPGEIRQTKKFVPVTYVNVGLYVALQDGVETPASAAAQKGRHPQIGHR